jgi:energy-coupling factor transporter ATP-binding protein EcfA2
VSSPESTDGPPTAESFDQWLSKRPRWLQTAARRLIEDSRSVSDEDIAALTKLCCDEAAGKQAPPFRLWERGLLDSGPTGAPLRIQRLENVQGINAISDGAALDFGDANITVVYGDSGSGKSGFARVIKLASGSRAQEELHPNAFAELPTAPAATIWATRGGEAKPFEWTPATAAIPALRSLQVFDARAAEIYLTEKSEASYEPRRLRFLSALAAICDRVTASIAADQASLQSTLPTFPASLAGSTGASWLADLKGSTISEDIDRACDFSAADDSERIATEAALVEKDVKGQLRAIGATRAALEQLRKNLDALKTGLSNVVIERAVVARVDAQNKREIATIAATKAFGDAPLSGVGQKEWLALWEEARKYSEAHAYPHIPFPATGGGRRCPLCQQQLATDASNRLSHFEEFVRGGLESTAKVAEQVAQEALRAVGGLPPLGDWQVQVSLLKIGEQAAGELFEALQARSAAAATAPTMQDVPGADWTSIHAALAAAGQGLDTSERALQALDNDEGRLKGELRVKELNTQRWLMDNKNAIVKEVRRLQAIEQLAAGTSLARTNAITLKKNELAESELARGYQTRFAAELGALGGKRLLVYPDAYQEGKAKIRFRLMLRDAKRETDVENVLSEGEARIVALAAFLADLTGGPQSAPFVFDDPISSLDQDFEEAVVNRLIDLATTRQVIVFTHRLSLVTLIEHAVSKLDAKAVLVGGKAAVSLEFRSLYRFGGKIGLVHDLDIRHVAPRQAVNRLRDQHCPQLRKMLTAGDQSGYGTLARQTCTELRIVLERCVEKVLLNGVVLRFRRSVTTDGKIGALAKISRDDCLLIDELMTRYSAFEHSQADELPAALPDLDDLIRDIKRLAVWIVTFETRQ